MTRLLAIQGGTTLLPERGRLSRQIDLQQGGLAGPQGGERNSRDRSTSDSPEGAYLEREDGAYLEHELAALLPTEPSLLGWLRDEALDGGWYWNLELPEHQWLSPRFWTLLGESPAEHRHLTAEWMERIHPSDLERARVAIERHCQDASCRFDLTLRYRHRRGKTVWLRCHGVAIRSAEGKATRMIGVHRDVTPLAEHEARFRSVLESAPCALFIVDRRCQIVIANRRVESIFGVPARECAQRELDDLLPGNEMMVALEAAFTRTPGGQSIWDELTTSGFESSDETERAWAAPRAGTPRAGTPIELEITTFDGDRTPRDLFVTVAPLDGSDNALAVVSATDVTAINQQTDALRRNRLELEQFVYVASHDLQEPLRMVANFTELLGRNYKGRLDERADRYIEYASEGARRIQSLVNDLLRLSRLSSQRRDRGIVSMETVLRSALDSLDSAGGDTKVDIDSEPLPAIRGHAGQLTMLLEHLIDNAIKFRSAARPPRVEVRVALEPPMAHFTLTDNGIGIDEQQLDRVFQIFQRLHSRQEYPGNGIGLAMCRRIVDLHGGRIWLDSRPGVGTTVHFTLPCG